MASIYLSSTFKDLEAHRSAVVVQLNKMQHKVTAMEHYVARDDRPVDACIKDVQASDLYIGVFAWRYGHIPKDGNPDELSVTEMEYLAAKNQRVPMLVFLLDEDAAWSLKLTDSHTGDGKTGARIRALRARLSAEHLADFFVSPQDLAAKVAAAVHTAGALSSAPDVSLDLAQIAGADVVDRPEMLFNQSYTPYLVENIARLGSSPLLKIDLRDGKHWFSTRLYALATLAHEYTSVDWLLLLSGGTDYVGMVRPADLRQALVSAQPELEEAYRKLVLPALVRGESRAMRAGEVLAALVESFKQRPGGEAALLFLVSAPWIRANVPALNTAYVERAGPLDPLATYELLQKDTPFVPITKSNQLLMVIDRVGVVTEIARRTVERSLGRR